MSNKKDQESPKESAQVRRLSSRRRAIDIRGQVGQVIVNPCGPVHLGAGDVVVRKG